MTPTNQSVSGDAQNFGRPLQPLVHGTGPCWPGEIPDQRGCGTVEFKHGPIRPCKSLRDRTKWLLGTPLDRQWGREEIRARIRGTWPSVPPSTARGTARTALDRVKSPTNEAAARSGSTKAQSVRAKVYAIAPNGFWAPLLAGHGAACTFGHAHGALGRASHRRRRAARPERPLAEGNPRPTRLWHGRGRPRPNPPVQKSTRSHQRASGNPFRPPMGQRAHSGTHTGHLAEHPTIDWARHGPNGSWPNEIPDQRGCGTVGVDHGQIRPCKSLRDRTKCLLGTPLGRPWGSLHIRARTRGFGTSLASSTTRASTRHGQNDPCRLCGLHPRLDGPTKPPVPPSSVSIGFGQPGAGVQACRVLSAECECVCGAVRARGGENPGSLCWPLFATATSSPSLQ